MIRDFKTVIWNCFSIIDHISLCLDYSFWDTNSTNRCIHGNLTEGTWTYRSYTPLCNREKFDCVNEAYFWTECPNSYDFEDCMIDSNGDGFFCELSKTCILKGNKR